MSTIEKKASDYEELVKLVGNPEVTPDQDGDLIIIKMPSGTDIVGQRVIGRAASTSTKKDSIPHDNSFLRLKVSQLWNDGSPFVMELNAGTEKAQQIQWVRELPGM